MTLSSLNRVLPTPARLRRTQLRTRVLAGVLAVVLLTLAVFDVAAVTALRRYLLNQTDTQLQNVLKQYRPFTVNESAVGQWLPGHPPVAATPRQSRLSKAQRQVASRAVASARRVHGVAAVQVGPSITLVGPRFIVVPVLDQFYTEYITRGGQTRAQFLRGNPDLRPRVPSDLRGLTYTQGAQTVASGNGQALLRIRAMKVADGTLIATTSLANVNQTVDQLQLIVAIGSAAAALLAALGVAWLVRRGVRPIETMAIQADRISAGDLTGRVSPQDPQTEVGRLGAALNGMLARIEASVQEREASQELTRQFFADASHELRNPLASLRANAELYQQGALPSRPQVDEAMRRITLEAQRMSALVDDMLRLARLDQPPGQQQDPVDVSALVTRCADRAQAASPRHHWRADIADGLEVTGDEELLRRAVDNLLANVHAHTPAGTPATVTAALRGDTITVQVSDTGPGVPAGELPRIFDRFYRGGARTDPGTGLGLAIVAATAAAHHGAVEAAPNAPQGLCITLTLPACDDGRPPGPDPDYADSVSPEPDHAVPAGSGAGR
ncbi:MAG: sensor histidine kinase [Streptosporangiaceae bacterium]